MQERAGTLAQRFEQTNDEFIAAVERLDDAQWSMMVATDNCTVAALAAHVAGGHVAIAGWVRAVADGEPMPPVTRDMIDDFNHEAARKNAAIERATVLDRLRRHGANAAAMVRGLNDEQLERSQSVALFGGANLTVEALIENVLIGHPRAHLASLREATTPA